MLGFGLGLAGVGHAQTLAMNDAVSVSVVTQHSVAPLPIPRRVVSSKNKVTRRKPAQRSVRRGRFVRLHDVPGIKVRMPHRAWGTRLTVDRIKEVGARYRKRFPHAEPLIVHDLSKRRGGKFWPHKSHRTGRDVDIRVVHKNPPKKYTRATPRTMDVERMWFLITALIGTGDVEMIFLDRWLQRALFRHALSKGMSRDELAPILQYPRGRRRAVVRHAKGHADHIHVRFLRRTTRLPVA